MASKRQCENWLKGFLNWTLPVSEAPESLLIWTGLFCLSAVLKKKVRFSKEYLKKYDIYPTTYIIFVGPPGVVRKSTSAGYGQEIIVATNKGLPVTSAAYVNLGPTSGSHVAIIDKMSEAPDGSITIISGEFGNIVSTTPDETYDFLAKMFDSDATADRYLHSTRGHGDTAVLHPSLNILGCTTPEWMSENTGYMLGGGFAARTIFIFENKARARHLFYKGVGPTVAQLNNMQEKLVTDLKYIGRTIKGEAKPENDKLAERMEKWYLGYVDKQSEKGTETFQARKHVHTLRTAMLLSVSERDDLIITEGHFDAALVLIDEVERRLARGLSSVGRNPYSGFLYEVLDYIEVNEPIARNKVMSRFWADLQMEELDKIVSILKLSGEIVEDSNNMLKLRKDGNKGG